MKRQIARIGTFYHRSQKNGGNSRLSFSHVLSLQRQGRGANRNTIERLPLFSLFDKKVPSFTGNRYHGQHRSFTTSSSTSSAQKRAQRGSWASLSPTEQAAWQVLHYTQDSWEGRQPPPPWKEWSDLTLDELAAVQYGLNVHTKDEWSAMAPAKSSKGIPSLQSLLDGTYDSDDDNDSNHQKQPKHNTNKSLMIAQETRALRKQQQSSSKAASVANMAFNTVKGLAPIVGPMIRSAARHAKGHKGFGLALAGTLLESIPAAMDATSGVLDVTGIDTVIYLDDSGSMTGSNLYQGQSALQSLERRLKTHNNNNNNNDDDDNVDDDQRFLPTRIVKFGNHPTILSPSDEDWSVSLVYAAWDGSSGGTYMWKMIQDDIEAKYRPAGGKLRVVVITDGADNLSPGPYYGTRGFDPLMNHLLRQGFDIEWHIIVVGNYGLFGSELSQRDKTLYQSLCRATGGQFISVESHGWDEDNPQVAGFLEAIEDSGYHDSKEQRRKIQEQYKLEARKGKAENFDWLPALPTNDDDDDNNKK